MGFSALFKSARTRDDYWIEDAIIKFTVQLYSRMRARKISQEELGDRIGVAQPYIARILKGKNNFTIATMVKLARAAGGNLDVSIRDGESDEVATGVGEFVIGDVVKVSASVSVRSTPTKHITLAN